jgi:hypothetical protein
MTEKLFLNANKNHKKMPQKYIDIDTIKFQINQTYDLESLLTTDYYSHHDMESLNLYMESIKDFSDKELFPCFVEMDSKPAHYKDGGILVHPAVETIMKKGGEMGIIAATAKLEDNGLQMPLIVHTAAYAIMEAANNHLPGYPGLTMGAADLILEFASDELKEKYAARMLTGEWGGTMCLTEPQAGGDHRFSAGRWQLQIERAENIYLRWRPPVFRQFCPPRTGPDRRSAGWDERDFPVCCTKK